MPIVQRLFRRLSSGLSVLGVDPGDSQGEMAGAVITPTYNIGSDRYEQLFPSRRWAHVHGTYTSPAFAAVISGIEIIGPIPNGCWVYSIRNATAATVKLIQLVGSASLISANRDDTVSSFNFYGDESLGGNPSNNLDALFQQIPTGLGGTGPAFISVGTTGAAPFTAANSETLSLNNQTSLHTPFWIGPTNILLFSGQVVNTAIAVDIGVQLCPFEG